MDIIQTILWEFRYVILILIVLIVYFIIEWQRTKVLLYQLMVRAKSLAKDAILRSGTEQENWVVAKAYMFLPRRITIFITQEKMHSIVHYLYVKAKDYIDDGIMNNSQSDYYKK